MSRVTPRRIVDIIEKTWQFTRLKRWGGFEEGHDDSDGSMRPAHFRTRNVLNDVITRIKNNP